MNMPDYYAVLGLRQDASPEEIKKRFRELARRYHPDVAKTPDATNRFKEINEAHRVLSDPEKRARYDAELKLARLQAEGMRGSREAGGKEKPPPASQTPNGQRSSSSARTPNTEHRTPSPAERLVAEAAAAFRRMKFREAEAFCRQALRYDRRHAAAYEMMGDIHRMRGRIDEAIAMYSFALQLDRRNRSAQAKFDRLVGQSSGPTMAGHAARTSRQSGRRASTGMPIGSPTTPTYALIHGLGIGLFAFLLIVVGAFSEPPATSALFLGWDPLAIFALLTSGALGGLILSLNSLLHPAREELAQQKVWRYRRLSVPLGTLLLGTALVFFYAAFLLYVLIGFARGTVSTSVLRAFYISFGIAALFALVSRASALFLFLFGGNVVFIAFVAGWAAGDLFRR